MNKFRIKQVDNKFFPQYRMWLFWFNFQKDIAWGSIDQWFSSKLNARIFLDNQPITAIKKKVIIHNYLS